MNFSCDELLIIADRSNDELQQLDDNMLIEIASSARSNRYYNCGHNLGVRINNLAGRCDYVRSSR